MFLTIFGIILIGLGVLDHIKGTDPAWDRGGRKLVAALRENIITIGLILVLGGVSSLLGTLVNAHK